MVRAAGDQLSGEAPSGGCRSRATTQEEGISPWASGSVVLAATIPLAEVGGDQHLGGLVNMAYHQRHGGGTLGVDQGRGQGKDQGDEQEQWFDLHGYLLGKGIWCDPDHFLS